MDEKERKKTTRKYDSEKRKLLNSLLSVKQKVKKETENILDTHKALKTSFFAPTSEEIQRFTEDIPNFLTHFVECGSIKEACRRSNALNPKLVYYLEHTEPQFKEDMDIARRIFAGTLNDVAHDRAIHGTDTTLSYRGEAGDTIKTHDNRLLETVLKANLPHLYDRKSLDRIPGHDKPQLNINIVNFAETDKADVPSADGEAIDVPHTTIEEKD